MARVPKMELDFIIHDKDNVLKIIQERDDWKAIAEKLAGMCFDAECLCPRTYEVCGKTFWDKECDIIKCYIDYARKQIEEKK